MLMISQQTSRNTSSIGDIFRYGHHLGMYSMINLYAGMNLFVSQVGMSPSPTYIYNVNLLSQNIVSLALYACVRVII